MKLLTLLLLFLTSISAYGGVALCNKVESKGEGHWPIREDHFTKSAAYDSLKKLEHFVDEKSPSADYVSIENALIYLKGYVLKKYADPNDEISLKEYCDFIENEAYIRH